MKKIIFSLILGLGALNSAMAAEGNVDAGKEKSGVCAACHGVTGHSASDTFPNLAGQNVQYIVKQLTDFKAGNRTDAMMAPMAANLSGQDMADLAAYFSSQSRTVETASADTASANTVSASPAANVAVVTKTTAAAIFAGNAKAGQEKSAMCTACHGTDGNSVVPSYPKLAGQSANYLAKQLADFKSGVRKNAVMAPMAAGLSDTDMQDLAAFFAIQKTTAGTTEASSVGHKLYFGGDAARGITACVACHGVKGKGMSQAAFPSIAGQNQDYLKAQLMSFRSGERSNDNNSIMRNIAIKLSDADVNELTQYMSSLK